MLWTKHKYKHKLKHKYKHKWKHKYYVINKAAISLVLLLIGTVCYCVVLLCVTDWKYQTQSGLLLPYSQLKDIRIIFSAMMSMMCIVKWSYAIITIYGH